MTFPLLFLCFFLCFLYIFFSPQNWSLALKDILQATEESDLDFTHFIFRVIIYGLSGLMVRTIISDHEKAKEEKKEEKKEDSNPSDGSSDNPFDGESF